MLYFDSCSTTKPLPEVVQTMSEVMASYFGNPSSIHRIGAEAEKLVKMARDVVARSLRVEPESVIFTSGGTESNNTAIVGAALQYRSRGKHLVTTEIEHPSVYECFRYLETVGFDVTYIKPDRTGKIAAADVERVIRDDTILVSVMHVNNEVGTVQPIREIGQRLRKFRRVLFHVDAVQSIGKIDVDPVEWGVDMMSVSAHKLGGPKGIGILYRRKGLQLVPLLHGGGQEHGIRSGTENVPAIVAMAKALRLATERRPTAESHMYGLRNRFLNHIKSNPRFVYNGSEQQSDMAPHIVNVSVLGLKPEVVVHALAERDIFISTKSACSSAEDKPSRVLLAMGLDESRAASGLRISFLPDHTPEDVDRLAEHLIQVVEQLGRYQ